MSEKILKYFDEEKRDADEIKIRRKKLDEFFEKLDKDPLYLMPDGCSKADIFAEDCRLQKAACMRKITVFESQLRELYSQMSGMSFAMMEDPVYVELSEKVLNDLADAIDRLEDMIEKYSEELEILGFDILECERETL